MDVQGSFIKYTKYSNYKNALRNYHLIHVCIEKEKDSVVEVTFPND